MQSIDALLEQLRVLDTPISRFDIGMPLLGAGHSQDQFLNALFYLEAKKQIELPPGNRRRLFSC
ncbi:hypothetical protein [Rhizobium wenxiniae]|uniref:hypothetical protein n=1 Tax=Rhizobium wenxiniae TaxID=1737357 RepID=UPI003C21C6A5